MKKIPAFILSIFFSLCIYAQPCIRLYNKGVRYAANGDYKKAETFFSKAIRANSFLTEAWFNRALARSKSGRYREAIGDYTQTIKLRPEFTIAYNNRGCDRNELKDFSGALEDYTKSIEQDSGYAKAWYNRGVVKTAQEEYASAIDDFLKAMALEPDFAGIRDKIALARTALLKKAVTAFAARYLPDDTYAGTPLNFLR